MLSLCVKSSIKAALLFVCTASIPAQAQFRGEQPSTLVRHVVGQSGVCPSQDDAIVKDRFRRPKIFVNQGFGFTFFIDPNLSSSFENSFPASETIDLAPPLFARVTLYGQSEINDRWLAGWTEANGLRKCAWLPTSSLVGGNKIISIKDLRNGPRVLQVRDLELLSNPDSDSRNTLFLKVILSNLNVSGDKGIPVYSSPDAEKPFQYRSLFELYAVYDFSLGKARKNNNAAHFLIGKDEWGSTGLAGWVHQDDVFEWNSRMAVFGAVPNLRVFVQAEDKDTRNLVESSLITDIPFQEFEGKARQRFPVMRSEPDAPEIKERIEALYSQAAPVDELSFSRQVDGYQVVLPTSNCNAEGVDCRNPDEFEQLRQNYQQKVDSLQIIDVMLLMDATESMDRYFAPTAQAVAEFAEETLADGALVDASQLRISVFIYGDYQNGTADHRDVSFLNVVPWHRPSRNSSELQNMGLFSENFASLAPKDPEEDKYEASLAAVIRAAEDRGWREEAGYRMVVHLADHGSRPMGRTSGEAGSQLVEQYSVAQVVEQLRNYNILYVPVSVFGRVGVESEKAKEARKAFLDQAEAIQEANGIRQGVARTYRAVGNSETDAQRKAAVLEVLNEAWSFNVVSRDTVRIREVCARSPGHPTCPILDRPVADGSTGAKVAQFLDDTMGLTREQIANIYSRRDNVVTAWLKPIAENLDGEEVEALSYWVAIDNRRFEAMSRGFDELCSLIQPSDQGRDISGRIVEGFGPIISEFANEGNKEFYRRSPLAQALSLPFIERSAFLSLSPGEIESIVANAVDEDLRELRGAFCRTSFLFDNIVGRVRLSVSTDGQERAPRLDELDLDTDGFVIGAGAARVENDYDWIVKIDRGEGIVFVPFDYFP